MYRISTNEFGTILLKRRKISKALRWWLRENGYDYTSNYFTVSQEEQDKIVSPVRVLRFFSNL
jgi:hypothetical protein